MKNKKERPLIIPFTEDDRKALKENAEANGWNETSQVKWVVREWLAGRIVPASFVRIESLLSGLVSDGLIDEKKKRRILAEVLGGTLPGAVNSGDIQVEVERE